MPYNDAGYDNDDDYDAEFDINIINTVFINSIIIIIIIITITICSILITRTKKYGVQALHNWCRARSRDLQSPRYRDFHPWSWVSGPFSLLFITRSLGARWTPTSIWRPFGPGVTGLAGLNWATWVLVANTVGCGQHKKFCRSQSYLTSARQHCCSLPPSLICNHFIREAPP